MAVTHNITLVANGVTLSMQGDLESGDAALIKCDTDSLTLGQNRIVLKLFKCLGDVGKKFGDTPITSFAVTAI